MDVMNFIKPELLILVPVLYTVGLGIKKSKVSDNYIPLILGIVSIFTYGMQKGLDRLAAAEAKNYSLSNLDALVEVAAEEGYIKAEDKERILKFRNNPSDESWIK